MQDKESYKIGAEPVVEWWPNIWGNSGNTHKKCQITTCFTSCSGMWHEDPGHWRPCGSQNMFQLYITSLWGRVSTRQCSTLLSWCRCRPGVSLHVRALCKCAGDDGNNTRDHRPLLEPLLTVMTVMTSRGLLGWAAADFGWVHNHPTKLKQVWRISLHGICLDVL